MSNNERTILIVDDSEIDREILSNILSENFEVLEAGNGFSAIEIVSEHKADIDAIMLDISMPHISGFDVLRLLKDNGLSHIPVFLITAEATKENVMKAAQFNIAEFISKPFDRDDILQRMKAFLGINTQYWLTVEDITQIHQYVEKLTAFYRTYLFNFGKDDSHYARVADLMQILLTKYAAKRKEAQLDKDKIEIISKAAYFCDIGFMIVPDRMAGFSRDPEKLEAMTRNHTKFGSSIVKLGETKHCAFFVEVCSEICMNHHERYDGYGYPRGIGGKNLSEYSQLCRLADEFDTKFSKLYGANDLQANLVMKQMLKDDGLASEELMSMFEDCKTNIIGYYAKKKQK